MTHDDLDLEALGYTHARLKTPPTSNNPHYHKGYQDGDRDRHRWGQQLDQTFQNFQNFHLKTSTTKAAMWTVWYYTPAGTRKQLDRFNTRNEAEATSRLFQRLIGAAYRTVVCFES